MVTARAADALGETVTAGGRMFGPVDNAPALSRLPSFNVPAVTLREPVHGGTSGMIDLRGASPAQYVGEASDLGPDILGAGYFALQGPMLDLWGKARQSGLITEASHGKIVKAMRQGLIALPSTSPDQPPQWLDFVAMVDPIWKAYAKGEVEAATRLAIESSRRAEFWDGVEAALIAVRDAPASAVAGGFDMVGKALGAIGWKGWLILGGVALLAFGLKAAPAIVSRRKAKA